MDIDSPSTNTSPLIKDEESHQPRKSKFSEDRLNQCPILVRVFIKEDSHHKTSDFENEQLPDNQVFIHVWMDSNLREIGDIIRHERPELKLKKLGFSLVYNEPRSGTWKLKTLGNLVPMKITRYEHLNLRALKFRPGNYISLRVY